MASKLRDDLIHRYGFTRVNVRFTYYPKTQIVEVTGEVLVRKIAEVLKARIIEVIPKNWTLTYDRLTTTPLNEWRELQGEVIPVFHAHPAHNRALATKLLKSDGPVQVLLTHQHATLVRLNEGTTGWIAGELGAKAAPPVLTPPRRDSFRLIRLLRSYRGTPYELGGTTQAGIDCSGLIQRCFREALGIVLPRHSADQLLFAGWEGQPSGENCDIVFAWTKRDGPCHVGILLDSESQSIIHASTARREVIEESMESFLVGVTNVAYTSLARLYDISSRSTGKIFIELPLDWVSL